MTSFPLSNVLLPAVCVSSAVFSTLTLPFALVESEPMIIELPPFFSGEIQPIFNGKHREVAIPYVGFAIVASVGAGIASVEVNRRWHAYRESSQPKVAASKSQAIAQGETPQPEPLTPPDYKPQASARDLTQQHLIFGAQSLISSTRLEQQTAINGAKPVVAVTQLMAPQRLTPKVSEAAPPTTLDQTKNQKPGQVEQDTPPNSAEPSTQEADPTHTILSSPSQYHTCRIKVPYLEHCLFAICVEGQYYSFLKSETTEEKLRETIAKLGDSLGRSVITRTEKSYVAWVWEPEATPKLATRSGKVNKT